MDELLTQIAEYIVAETRFFDGYVSESLSTYGNTKVVRYLVPNVLVYVEREEIRANYWAPNSGVIAITQRYDYGDPQAIINLFEQLRIWWQHHHHEKL